jgi:ribosomal protein L7Ae-like RNA K-turn-binding protein
MNSRLHGYLGLANRARKALIGEAINKGWSKGRMYLLIIARDASLGTQEKIEQKARHYQIAICYVESKAELGLALGYDEVSAIANSDRNLANKIQEVIKEETK